MSKFGHLKFRHPNKKSTRLQSKTLRAPLCTAWPCPSRFACFRSPRDAKLEQPAEVGCKKEQGEIAAKLCQGCVSIYIYYNITYNHLHKPVGGGNESQKHPSCNQAFTKAMDAEKQRLF